ncbi:MAG: hypothetical protein C4523_07030 [Myxococcales bacterium]|nr:MAG: hypothetical protein C4523_07030 [Myxococcales bacterium]
MKRWLVCLLGTAVLLWPLALLAQESGESEDQEAVEDSAGLGGEAVTEDEYAEEAEKQRVDAPTEDAKGVETYWGTDDLVEVEKGFFIDMRLGPRLYLKKELSNSLGPSLAIAPGLGYDVVPKLLSLEIDGLFAQYSQDVYKTPAPADGTARPEGDLALPSDFLSAGVQLAVNIQYFTTKRFEAVIAPTGGLMWTAISGGDSDGDIYVEDGSSKIEGSEIDYFAGARLGVEYYTGLRHFSIGFDVEFDYMIKSGEMALSLYPMLKYTF